MKKAQIIITVLLVVGYFASAATIPSGAYATWGIRSSELTIPRFATVSDAQIIIYGPRPADAPIDIYILDEPRVGFHLFQRQNINLFEKFGERLNGVHEEGFFHAVLTDSENDNPQSPIYTKFKQLPILSVYASRSSSTARRILYTSSLLRLIDAIGNGGTFGLGLASPSGAAIDFQSLKLRITVSSFNLSYADVEKTYTFSYQPETADQTGFALQLDGQDDVAKLGYRAPVNQFTVACWFQATEEHEIDLETNQVTATSGLSGQRFLFAPETVGGLGVSVGTNGVSVYEFYRTGAPALAVYQAPIGADWNHLAICYMFRRPLIYLNGLLVYIGQESLARTMAAPTLIGGGPWGYFSGKVAGVAIWNVALNPYQVLAAAQGIYQVKPLGRWELDEGFGDYAFDSSGNGFRATLDGPEWTTIGDADLQVDPELAAVDEFQASENGYVLGFKGRGSFAQLNYPHIANNFTISAWVKTTLPHQIDRQVAAGVGGWRGQRYLFGADRCGGTQSVVNGGVGVSVGTNGISVYEYYFRSMPAVAVYQGNLGTGWNHIAITYTDKQPRIYLNGLLVHIGIKGGQGDVFAPTKLGGNSLGYFVGQAANVCIFDRPLSGDEIRQLSANNIEMLNPVACWLLDEGQGNAISDIFNGYEGILTNTTWVGL